MRGLIQSMTSDKLPDSMLRSAVVSTDPAVRAIAARLVGVLNVLATRDALLTAFAGETDPHVMTEQVNGLLLLGTPETVAAVEGALGRHGVGVAQYAEWLARNSPDRLIEQLPSLAAVPHTRKFYLATAVVLAAAQHPDKRRAIVKAAMGALGEEAWAIVIEAVLGSPEVPEKLTLLRDSLASSNATARERAVWAAVDRLASPSVDVTKLAAVFSAVVPEGVIPAWEGLGREIIERHSRRTMTDDRSALLAREAPQHRSDALGLLSYKFMHGAELAAIRKALNVTNDQGKAEAAGKRPLQWPAKPGPHLFPQIWPGFMNALFEVTGCRPANEVRMGGTKITFDPSGRAAQFLVDTDALGPSCATALRSLRHITFADPSDLFDPSKPQRYLLPVDSQWVACGEAPLPAWTAPTDDEPPTENVERPQKIRDAQPRYPQDAKAAGVEGIVVIEAMLSETGCVADAKVVRGVSDSLDLEALTTVSKWRYSVARRAGKPVAVMMTVALNFNLH
jgi:TonB family protein